ncbi:MAG: xylulokinase [Acidimicrobiales bacterium]
MPLVAGVDCSTQATKVLVVDADDGTVVASASEGHEVQGEGGARETDPQAWARSLAGALARTGVAGQLAAISVGAQQHGLVVLDKLDRPLRPALLWNDTRSAPDARSLIEDLGGPQQCAERVGSVLSASFTVAHWAWLRRTEPDVASGVHQVMLPHDYLSSRLTGRAGTDRSDVSGTGWWAPGQGAYDAGVLSLATVRLDPARLPEVLPPGGAAGVVTPGAAEHFGLRAGVQVACGAGDNAAAALALDLRPGEAALSLGTSGTVYAIAEVPSADPTGTVAGFASADGRFLPLACTLNATLAVDQTCEWLGLGREDVVGSGGVVFLPWLGGERTPNVPGASGTLSGLRYGTDRRAILQAAYEGVIATLLEAEGALHQWAPQDPAAPLLLLGGGARGKVWQDVVRRLSGRPVLVVESAELVAYGAAVQAAALLAGSALSEVARAWGTRRGALLGPVGRDEEMLARIASWRRTVLSSVQAGL